MLVCVVTVLVCVMHYLTVKLRSVVAVCRPALRSRDYLDNAKQLKHRADDAVSTSMSICLLCCLLHAVVLCNVCLYTKWTTEKSSTLQLINLKLLRKILKKNCRTTTDHSY